MDELCRELENILKSEAIETLFQPIVDLKTAEIIGYEALSRGPVGSDLYSPVELIRVAHQCDRIWELELLFRQKALERAKNIGEDKLLFINIDPDIIKTPGFQSGLTKAYLDKLAISENKIVFEITERTAINDMVSFKEILDNYRSQGYMVAIDDAGAGYSGLKTIHEVRPHFIKIDMDLIRNIDKDSFKQSLIKALIDVASTTNIKIIAEGIETKDELKTLILLGVHAGQGYYLRKPDKSFPILDEDLISRILSYQKISANLNGYDREYHYISNLVTQDAIPSYEPMVQCETIRTVMEKNQRASICICENDYPVGLVMKHNLDEKLSGLYGYSLFANRPISKVMNQRALIVDQYTPIDVVAKKAMERNDAELYDDIVVTKGMKYLGIVPMKHIIEYTLMMEKNTAKEHNPLTGLPGNPVIKRVISDLSSYPNDSMLCYVDINEFKIYNDVYGFENGDKMIRMLARILDNQIKMKFPHSSFIGHIGGDDFIVILPNDSSGEDVLVEILKDFEENKMFLFNNSHRMSGVIRAKDRFEVERELPLTSLSISALSGDLSRLRTPEHLSEVITALKKKTKLAGKSAYCIEKIDAK